MRRFLQFFLFGIITFFILAGINTVTLYAQNVKKFHQPVCGKKMNEFHCHAHIITDASGIPDVTVSPYGFGPAQFRGAYNLSGSTSANQTIALVDAYDDPSIFSDVNTYSSYFGIPLINSCPLTQGTTSHPCFQKVNQNGGSSLPAKNSNWALEISLDVEISHALCQNCNILLVEANSPSYSNLLHAVDRAVIMGAKVVSNSYGSNEFSSEIQLDPHFNKPGVAFIFSSGDSGYGTSYPAASPYVTAAGGTTLNVNGNTYLSESVWSGAGSGCSLYETKPSWQTDSGCKNRTIADVSADADPNTGAAIFDSFPYFGFKGWFTVGGTSLASPIIASSYALGGIPAATKENSLPYSHSASLHDITSGSNGICSIPYLCNGVSGYDGPSGMGTPFGTAAF